MTLKNIYHDFSKYLNKQKENFLAEKINEDAARLNIYLNNVLTNKANSLAIKYPAISAIVGNDFFKKFAQIYAQNTPSTSGDLTDYGDSFPEFIAEKFPLHQLEYLTDLALLEQHLHQINQRQEDNWDPQKQRAEHLLEKQLQLKQSCALISSKFPIGSLYLFTQNTKNSPPDLNKNETILLRKINQQVEIEILTEEEIFFLQKLQQDKLTLEELFAYYHDNKQTEIFNKLLEKFLAILTETNP